MMGSGLGTDVVLDGAWAVEEEAVFVVGGLAVERSDVSEWSVERLE